MGGSKRKRENTNSDGDSEHARSRLHADRVKGVHAKEPSFQMMSTKWSWTPFCCLYFRPIYKTKAIHFRSNPLGSNPLGTEPSVVVKRYTSGALAFQGSCMTICKLSNIFIN